MEIITYTQQYLPLLIALPLFIATALIFITSKKLNYYITLLTFACLFIISFSIMLNYNFVPIKYNIGNFAPPFGIELQLNGLNLLFICLISFISFCIGIWNYKFLVLPTINIPIHIINSIFIICLSGYIGMLLTNDMFNLFVFLEIVSICTYILISLGEKKQSFLTSFNYLLVGSLATTFYMFGIGIFYIIYGTLNFDILIEQMQNISVDNPILILGYVLILLSLIIKIGLYPACYLVTNYYSTSYYSVAAFLSGTATKVFIYIFIKMVVFTFSINKILHTSIVLKFIMILGFISIFLGAFRAIKTHNIKHLLAYSSISQIGTIMVAVCILNLETLLATYYLIISHAIVKTGLFLCIGILYNKYQTDSIVKLKGTAREHKFLLLVIVVLAFSLAGFPMTSIFWGKLYLLTGSLMYDNLFAFILIVLSSVLSFIYSWRLIFNVHYIRESNKDKDIIKSMGKSRNIHFSMYVSIFFILTANIILSLFPTYMLNMISKLITLSIK